VLDPSRFSILDPLYRLTNHPRPHHGPYPPRLNARVIHALCPRIPKYICDSLCPTV
jgi:hypothetical protein